MGTSEFLHDRPHLTSNLRERSYPFTRRGNASLFPMDPIPLPEPLFPPSALLVSLQGNESARLRHNVPWEGCQIRPGQRFSLLSFPLESP